MSERSLAGTHGQSGVALTLSAVRSGGHSLHSQADSAGSILVTRSKCENHCRTIKLDTFSFAETATHRAADVQLPSAGKTAVLALIGPTGH
jgi:hypothetical protein